MGLRPSVAWPALLALSLVLPGAARAEAGSAWTCDRSPLLVTRATLWQPEGLQADREFVVQSGRIGAVGAAGSLPRSEGLRVLDAGGALVLPGLVDAHAHFIMSGAVPAGWADDPFSSSYPVVTRQSLASGVTSARVHLWDTLFGPRLKAMAADDCYPAPRMQIGGPALAGGVPDVDGRVYKGVRSVADARVKVRAARAAGADWLAVHDLDRFAPGELEAVVDAARSEGLRLMAQGYRHAEYALALQHGFRSIDYLPTADQPLQWPAEVLAGMRARGDSLFLVPTLGVYEHSSALRADPQRLTSSPWTRFMPAAVAAYMEDELRKRIARTDDSFFSDYGSRLDLRRRQFKALVATGVPMALGTDVGSTGYFHADAQWLELAAWIRAGMTQDAAIKAATVDAAALLALDDIGVLRPGARGDFVVLRGPSLPAQPQIEDVRMVAKGGVIYVREGRWIGP